MQVRYVNQNEPSVYQAWIPWDSIQQLPDGVSEIMLGIEDGDLAVGLLACHVRGETCVIDFLYVAPAYRRRKCALLLLRELREICAGLVVEAECAYTETDEDHETLTKFLQQAGFVDQCDTQLTIFSTTLSQLEGTPLVAPGSDFGVKIDASDAFEKRKLDKFMQVNQAPAPEGGLFDDDVEWDLSRVHYDAHGDVVAYIIFEKFEDGQLHLAAAYNNGEPIVLMRLLQTVSRAAAKKYPGETVVQIQATAVTASELIAALLPEAERKSHRFVFRMRDWVQFALKTGRAKLVEA